MNISQTRITHISWGKMEVEVNGQTFNFKDCKAWSGGAKEWNWSITGTGHRPGIQPADIEEVLEQDVEIMILSRGMALALHTCPETEQLLCSKGIKYYIEETNRAVELFNDLMSQGIKVGGIFHSTC